MHFYFFRKNIGKRFLLLHLTVFLVFTNIKSQDSIIIRDTIDIQNKTVEKKKKSGIDDVISYKASDSIVFYANGKGFLYGKGTIHYKEIELKADYIEMDTDSSQVYASGVTDSIGNMTGFPVFKEGKDSYESRSIKYNFNTKKGYIMHAVTQQGEGYVVSEKTKKTSDDILCMRDGRYTTCPDHEHPHFYLNLTKAKVKPKSYIVTGPAYLVLADVPLPLIIPFGYFPFNDTYSSGIIMPTYGDELSRGFYLKDGGYYFAINDYFDFALTGDIYTKGSWGIKGASSYVKRYKFRGSFAASYLENLDGEKDLPNFSKSKDFSINWTHTQDPKANLYRTLSASVNFATSSYDRNSIESRYKPNLLSQNTKSSSISITQRFPESPWSISANMSANQRTQDSTINLNLPDLNLTMSRIYPLKRKNAIGKEKWYEKISMSYSGRFSNSITSKEKELANASFLEDWRNAVKHNIPISASFTIFKYLTITPSVNYNEKWYFSRLEKQWDNNLDTLLTDTVYGFKRIYDYSAGISMQTKVYGFFKPLPQLFGEKVNMIRWVMTPSLGYSMTPDFGAEKFGYWNSYVRYNNEDNSSDVVYYSPYEKGMFGVPSRGESGSVSFSLSNNVEMKVKSKTDSLKQFKKISLIDNLSLNSSYNLAADSLNLSNINGNIRLKITDKLGINLSGAFEPYKYELNKYGSPVRVNQFRWDNGKAPQLIGTSTSFGYALNNSTFKKKKKTEETTTPKEPEISTTEKSLLTKENTTKTSSDGYEKFSMPWNFRFDYSLRYGRSKFNVEEMEYDLDFSHNISFSGDLALTNNWKFSFSSSYDITNDQITYTSCNISRDLHCWTMTASFVPVGLYKSYNVTISVKSSLLKDLKYEQRGNSYEGVW